MTSTNRKYLPTLPELIDRLSIVQQKAIFIPENKEAYDAEIDLILHDIDLIIRDGSHALSAGDVHAIVVLSLANRFIWENESKARQGGREQDHLLRITHSVNGVRNTAKNIIARGMGERVDLKIDCIANDLPVGAGNWNIWS